MDNFGSPSRASEGYASESKDQSLRLIQNIIPAADAMKESTARAKTQNPFDNGDRKVTVIQCPSCQTKFALETQVVASLDMPRFHCSRCDHVFALDRRMLGLDRTEARSPAPVEPAHLHDDEFMPKSWAEESRTTRALEVPKKFSIPSSVAAPHEGIEEEIDPNQIAFNFDAPPPPPATPVENRGIFSFSDTADFSHSSSDLPMDSAEFKAIRDEAMGYASLARGVDSDAMEAWSDSIVSRDLYDPAAKSAPIIAAKSRWKNFMTLSSPLILFLALLGVASLLAAARPMDAVRIVSSYFPSIESAPPVDVVVSNTSLKRVALESGETMNIISGKIINNSGREFRDVQVEGVLFDRAGNVVARKKISAAASLGRTRIQSLTPEMIENLQTTTPAKRFKLEQGGSHEFTLAVPEEPGKASGFFSASVYSVRG